MRTNNCVVRVPLAVQCLLFVEEEENRKRKDQSLAT